MSNKTPHTEAWVEEILNNNRKETLFDSEEANEIADDAINNFIIVVLPELANHFHQQLQKALRCGKELPDGSICGCRLDCHLHDWRQRDELKKARHDWLREEIVKLEGMKEDEKTMLGEEIRHMRKGRNVIIQTIINRYHSELDQEAKEPYTQACGHSVDYIVYAIQGNEKGYCRACREDVTSKE